MHEHGISDSGVDVFRTCNAGRAGAQPYPPHERQRVCERAHAATRANADTPIRLPYRVFG